jgi:integrase
MDAIQAQRLLAPHKVSLTSAVKHYLKHLEKAAKDVPNVSQAAAEYLKDFKRRVEKKELREISLRNVRSRLGIFCDGIDGNRDVPPMGQHKISDIGLAEVYDFLNSLPYHTQTRAHYRAQLHSLFEFTRQRGWTEGNPVSQLARSKRNKRGLVRVLSVSEAEELLEQAQVSPLSRILVPRLALGLFVGLRPSETARLDWGDIDFNRRHVHIHDDNKTETERFVELNPTAYAWLRKYRGVGRVQNLSEGRMRRAWDQLRKNLGWGMTRDSKGKRHWVSDILRHSYGSYMLAVSGDDRYKVCALMGNSIPILNRHYRKAMPRQEAEPYWKILPDTFSHPSSTRPKKIKKN